MTKESDTCIEKNMLQLQNCIKNSSHTSEPANQLGSYSTNGNIILELLFKKPMNPPRFIYLFLVNQNQDLSFLADTRKNRGVAINSTRLTWVLTKDIATAIK